MCRNKGFTLVEMLVTVSILAVVMGGLSMTINTIMKTYDIARDDAIVLRQVQNTGYWMTQDIQRVAKPHPNLYEFPVSMVCYEGSDINATETIIYSYENCDAVGICEIYKSVNSVQTMLIAQYIDSNQTSILRITDNVTAERYYNLHVVANYNGKEMSGTYIIKPRVQ